MAATTKMMAAIMTSTSVRPGAYGPRPTRARLAPGSWSLIFCLTDILSQPPVHIHCGETGSHAMILPVSSYFPLASANVATYLLLELDVRVIPAGLLGLSLRVELAAVQVITNEIWPLLAPAEVIA